MVSRSMQVFESVEAAAARQALRGAALCLGNFDGVHLGHQALIAAAASRAAVAGVLTFQPHPGKVLQPSLAPRLISTPERKLELLEASGVAVVVVQPFTIAYAGTSPDDFEACVFDALGAKVVVVGADFTYGRKRGGTVETLRQAAARRAAQVCVVPAVTIDGVVVSSSKVREYLLEGRVEAAARLLGRPFDLDGTVVTGDQRGRTIGFPTANVASPNELQPATGVYAVRVQRGSQWHDGVANLGVKPTFGGAQVSLEAHLFDFAADVYGEQVRVQFIARLRAEQRFANVTELVAQIGRDALAAKAALAGGVRAPTF